MAVFTRVKTWVSNEVLTASDLNGEFNNLLNNTIPASIEDYSADVSTMQSTADPGGLGTESLATTLAGEIQRLRYAIKRIVNQAQWYIAPVGSLSNLGIVTANINDLAVTTGKINDLAVTKGKLAALGQQISSTSTGTFSTTSTSYTDITNLTATITTTGRPVWIGLVNDGSGNVSYIGGQATGSTSNIRAQYKILRDATTVSETQVSKIDATAGASIGIIAPVSGIHHVDVVAAGTYVYKVQALAASNFSAYCYYAKLVVFEL